ncbi:MAG: 6-phosphogluconolactonase [Betaproteobacteria bacterium]|nr:6-phosphogluconolactonase [Betaproteobacteria bacterium]
MSPALHIFTTPEAQAAQLAAEVANHLRTALYHRGQASLAVSGGKSPIAFFKRLSQAALDWHQVSITLVDERWVEPDSADSNERLVRQHLLQGPAAVAQFVPLKTAATDPIEALAERSHALAAMPRPFDVVVLGMGEDGHTASLFPSAAGLADAMNPQASPTLVAMTPLHAPHRRISFNLAMVLDARFIALSIQGPVKRRIFDAAATADALQWPVVAVLQQSRVPVAGYWSA